MLETLRELTVLESLPPAWKTSPPPAAAKFLAEKNGCATA